MTAIVGDDGTVLERCDCDPYGEVVFLEADLDNGVLSASAGNLGRVAPGDCSPGAPADPY